MNRRDACLTGRRGSAGPRPALKCVAIAELRPRLFLVVAAGETWRLFTVVERDGQAVLGDELPDLNRLHFLSTTDPC
jgi:hypothetical protein